MLALCSHRVSQDHVLFMQYEHKKCILLTRPQAGHLQSPVTSSRALPAFCLLLFLLYDVFFFGTAFSIPSHSPSNNLGRLRLMAGSAADNVGSFGWNHRPACAATGLQCRNAEAIAACDMRNGEIALWEGIAAATAAMVRNGGEPKVRRSQLGLEWIEVFVCLAAKRRDSGTTECGLSSRAKLLSSQWLGKKKNDYCSPLPGEAKIFGDAAPELSINPHLRDISEGLSSGALTGICRACLIRRHRLLVATELQ